MVGLDSNRDAGDGVCLCRFADDAGNQNRRFSDHVYRAKPTERAKEIAKRLSEKTPPQDYKLDESPFAVFVPPDYDASTPHGIVVYVGYKDAPACPESWKPLLQKTHTIYLSYSHHDDKPEVQIGRVLDGLANMKKLYNIDPQRIYSMGWHEEATMLSVMWGDVFLKPIMIEPATWRDAPLANNMHVPATVPKPSGPPLAAAKTHRLVFITRPEQKDHYYSIQKIFSQDGLTVKVIEVGYDEVHFPNVTAPWLEQAFEYLDAAQLRFLRRPATHQHPRTARCRPPGQRANRPPR